VVAVATPAAAADLGKAAGGVQPADMGIEGGTATASAPPGPKSSGC
jgi:hypothetical protein